jgi:hypothetical protein
MNTRWEKSTKQTTEIELAGTAEIGPEIKKDEVRRKGGKGEGKEKGGKVR